ncbi:MAG: hypothetical protein KY475_14925 [Planctomycetes bacterium]|nr:hypothetical protein [Planctomycetota bacterium]
MTSDATLKRRLDRLVECWSGPADAEDPEREGNELLQILGDMHLEDLLRMRTLVRMDGRWASRYPQVGDFLRDLALELVRAEFEGECDEEAQP